MPFDADTALRAAGDGAWEGAVVDGWNTPRGPLGGYVMAIVMRGLELAVADPDRQACSATMHFLRAPGPGPVTVMAQVERAGRSLTSVSGRLEQDGKLLGLALAAYSCSSCPPGNSRSRRATRPRSADHRWSTTRRIGPTAGAGASSTPCPAGTSYRRARHVVPPIGRSSGRS